MRMLGYALLYAALLLCVVAWNASAHRSPNGTVDGVRVRIMCASPAEDSLGHLRYANHNGYTRLADGTVRLRYVCRHAGY